MPDYPDREHLFIGPDGERFTMIESVRIKIDDFKTLPHIRSPQWWAMRSQKIELAVARRRAEAFLSEADEWALRVLIAKSLEPWR